MEFETIKNNLNDFIQENGLKYLRKTTLASFAAAYNYELEDINYIFEYNSSDITRFYERINDTKYKRYIIGAYLTNEAIQEATGLTYCDCCCVFTAEPVTTDDGNKYCNLSCAKYAGYDYCSECGALTKIHYSNEDIKLCRNCCKDNAAKYDLQLCSRCHKYVNKSRVYHANGKYYCYHCVENLNLLQGYHHNSSNWKPYTYRREKPLYFGWESEFEVTNGTPRNAIILGMMDILKEHNIPDYFRYETDASLCNRPGIEAKTEPGTLPWIYENIEALEQLYDYLKTNSCAAEKTTTAGLHIHFSRTALTKDYSLAKIAYLINKHQYDFVKFANRRVNDLHYCEFDPMYNMDNEIRLNEYKEHYPRNNEIRSSHGVAVNRQHENTIEIRIFKGTLDLHRIVAYIELINNLIYFVENHTDTQVENVTFKELCLFKKTKFLKQYYYKIFEPKTKIKEVA